ncbi:MAG: collagen-like protein [Betaproteobacteria bacterium]|nr:collagen-like protein [Betaproteobacteria bacterium]
MFMKGFQKLAIVLAIAFVCLVAGEGRAQVPQTINYQGYLTNAAGQPVNAPVNLTFRLYTAASGGSAIWTETQSNLSVTNGIYNAVLGSVTPFSLPFNTPYFLSLQVNSDAEMTVRQPLSAVPYAQRAVTAEALASVATVATSQLTGTIASAQLPATQLLPTAACADKEIPQWNGKAWICAPATGGGITSIATGAGLTGGPITTTGTISLLDTQLLPKDACAENQISKWDGKGWVCSSGTPGPAGPAGPQGIPGVAGPAGPQGPAGTILTLPQLQGMFLQSSIVQAPQATSLTAADSAAGVGTYSSLTIGADGLPVISYFDSNNGDLKVTKCGNAACSAGNTITPVDTSGFVGQHTSMTIGADGLPVISYYDMTNGDLKVAKCGNAACTAGNTITAVDTVGDVGHYTSIVIGADGLPVIAYYDVTNADPKVAKCGNASCSAGNTVTTVDPVAFVGAYAAIAIGANGLPVISFRAVGGIRLARCGNAACSTGNILGTMAGFGGKAFSSPISLLTIGADGMPTLLYVEVDAGVGSLNLAKCSVPSCVAAGVVADLGLVAGVPRGISMTTGVDGLPVIAYMDANNLKVVKCGNVSCSAANSSSDLGDVGSTGGYPSINIGTDGLPVISYFDGTTNSLKVAKCANTFCVAAYRQR